MWQEKDNALYKEFTFKDFNEAFAFMARVADIAENMQHHPRWMNEWNKVEIWLSTHEKSGQITQKDKDLAAKIDEVVSGAKAPDKKPVDTIREIKMFGDGGSRGNPGPSASGFALLDMQDEVLYKSGLYLGITTNNQAEYNSLKLGLLEAKKRGVRIVHVHMDSLLVINQMKGIFKVKNRDLWPVYEEIKKITADFEKVTFTHVPREFNKLADGMVNEILDSVNLNQV